MTATKFVNNFTKGEINPKEYKLRICCCYFDFHSNSTCTGGRNRWLCNAYIAACSPQSLSRSYTKKEGKIQKIRKEIEKSKQMRVTKVLLYKVLGQNLVVEPLSPATWQAFCLGADLSMRLPDNFQVSVSASSFVGLA